MSLSLTELTFIMFIHDLTVPSGQHISGNLPEPGDLGCGHRPCRRLHWSWEAEGLPRALLLIGKDERLRASPFLSKLGLSPVLPLCPVRKESSSELGNSSSTHILKKNSRVALALREHWIIHSYIY